MNIFVIRVIVAAIITSMLIIQARQAPAGSYRRRAFVLGAVSIGIFLVLNSLVVMGFELGAMLFPFVTVALLLLGTSVVTLVLAWRRGEMREQVERTRQAIEAERVRRQTEQSASSEQPTDTQNDEALRR